MEIYKLSDELPEGERDNYAGDLTKCGKYGIMRGEAPCGAGDSGGVLRVTEMRQGVKNPERVNVFVNNVFSFSLSVAQVVDFKLKVGQIISAERLEELKKASEFGKLYQRCLEWVLVRPRSEKEVYDYLRKKIYEKKLDGDYADDIVKKLIEKKYIDDFEFARWYVQNRFVKKGVSRKRLRMELMKKGVAKDVIEEALEGRDDKEEIRKMIAKKRGKYTDDKLVAYLCRQGFSYDLAQELMRENEG